MEALLICKTAALLLITFLLIGECECECSRRYSLDEPDCSTATFSDGQTCAATIPCFVKLDDGHLVQLEFPEDNTHTCYRTCIDSDNNQCEATLVPNIHNRKLTAVAEGSDYELRVFSQGFQRTTNRKYRKSSICRYKIACDKDKLLTYSIQTHILEEPATCCDEPACIDSLTLELPGMAARETTCGTINDPTTHSDGSTELLMEFGSNRRHELTGFMIIAWCVDPGVSTRQTRSVGSQYSHRTWNCTSPRAMWRRDGHGHEHGWEETDSPTTDPALLKLAEAFPKHKKTILHPSSIHITVDVRGHVRYTNHTITIHQPNEEPTEFPGITAFHLSNRIVNGTVFQCNAPGRYHGYGYIVMWRWEAFFLQDGVNPEFRPTDEEQAIIGKLQAGLKAALAVVPDTSGDGWDPDTSGDESNQDWSPPLISTARLYSNACNALLRSAACAYLQVVANENCEQSTGSSDTQSSTDSDTQSSTTQGSTNSDTHMEP